MKSNLFWCIPLLCLFIISCRKDPIKNLSEDESRLYITNYDTAASFSTYKTFSIQDSVAVISNNQLQTHERREIDALFIEAITNALRARGYTKVSRDENPDLGVAASRVSNTSTNIVSYNDYGNYYDSYWDPFYWDYGGYNYYFPTYYGVYQTNETAFMVDVFDLKNASQNNQIRSIWSGMIRGSGVFNSSSVESQVNALFSQSPYFKFQ
jgi:hypothetical protein